MHAALANDPFDLSRWPIWIEEEEEMDPLLACSLEAREDHNPGSSRSGRELIRSLDPEMVRHRDGFDLVPEKGVDHCCVVRLFILIRGRLGMADKIGIRIYLKRDTVEARARRAAKGSSHLCRENSICEDHRAHVTGIRHRTVPQNVSTRRLRAPPTARWSCASTTRSVSTPCQGAAGYRWSADLAARRP